MNNYYSIEYIRKVARKIKDFETLYEKLNKMYVHKALCKEFNKLYPARTGKEAINKLYEEEHI